VWTSRRFRPSKGLTLKGARLALTSGFVLSNYIASSKHPYIPMTHGRALVPSMLDRSSIQVSPFLISVRPLLKRVLIPRRTNLCLSAMENTNPGQTYTHCTWVETLFRVVHPISTSAVGTVNKIVNGIETDNLNNNGVREGK
jgi:hypothetical protein